MTGRWAPSWFGQGLLTRPSSATAVPDRRRFTWERDVNNFPVSHGLGNSSIVPFLAG